MIVTVNGNGNEAQATAAMPAVTPTPCGINVRIFESANPERTTYK